MLVQSAGTGGLLVVFFCIPPHRHVQMLRRPRIGGPKLPGDGEPESQSRGEQDPGGFVRPEINFDVETRDFRTQLPPIWERSTYLAATSMDEMRHPRVESCSMRRGETRPTTNMDRNLERKSPRICFTHILFSLSALSLFSSSIVVTGPAQHEASVVALVRDDGAPGRETQRAAHGEDELDSLDGKNKQTNTLVSA